MEEEVMNVAILELCKELYGLSGWRERVGLQYFPDKFYARLDLEEEVIPTMDESYEADFICPAYDLGYILRKLPDYCVMGDELDEDRGLRLQFNPFTMEWCIDYPYGDYPEATSSAPEDAACKLAIELFKQGILMNGGHPE